MFWLIIISICAFLLFISFTIENSRLKQEKKEGIVLGDPLAKYMGGFPDIVGGKGVYFQIKEDSVVLQIHSSGTKYIPMNDIINAEIKSETQINNEVSLGKIALFGVLALGMNSKTTTVNNYLVLTYMEYGKQRDIIIKSNHLENLVRTIRNLKF